MKVDDPKPQRSSKYRAGMRRLVRQTRAMTLLLRHPAVPWHAKVVAACSVGYLLSPIQLIPTFIPVIGQLDDLAVLYVGMKCLRVLTPPTLLEECEAHAATAAFFARPVACHRLNTRAGQLCEVWVSRSGVWRTIF